MSVSTLVVARNEAKHIEKCLASLITQSLIPDELIVICHNCTDNTSNIARNLLENQNVIKNWKVDDYEGPVGVAYARIRGFGLVKNELCTCLDADSYASHNWVQELVSKLQQTDVVAVGGFTIILSNLWATLMSVDFFLLKRIYSAQPFYFWGSNFGIKMGVYRDIGGIEPLIGLRTRLSLTTWSEDLYLSRRALERGLVAFAPKAVVYSVSTLTNWNVKNKFPGVDRHLLERYISKHPYSSR